MLDLIHIDRWKYKTPHRHFQIQGHAAWADFLFFLEPEALLVNYPTGEAVAVAVAVAKQVILGCMQGKKNYGEYLVDLFKGRLPDTWREELRRLARPTFPTLTQSLSGMRRAVRPLELFLKHQIGRSQHVAIQ